MLTLVPCNAFVVPNTEFKKAAASTVKQPPRWYLIIKVAPDDVVLMKHVGGDTSIIVSLVVEVHGTHCSLDFLVFMQFIRLFYVRLFILRLKRLYSTALWALAFTISTCEMMEQES